MSIFIAASITALTFALLISIAAYMDGATVGEALSFGFGFIGILAGFAGVAAALAFLWGWAL